LIARDTLDVQSWEQRLNVTPDVRNSEQELEIRVSVELSRMSILWITVDDDLGPASMRSYIERNSIALLSNYRREKLDPSSSNWLGQYCDREKVRTSGLWNNDHVDGEDDKDFLDCLEQQVQKVARYKPIAIDTRLNP
jgi:hypothetical protein